MAFDLTAVETAEQSEVFKPIPEGIYPLRVTDGCEKEREGKPPQHEFELCVQHGPHQGFKFKAWFSLSEGHAPFLKLFYEQLGATEDQLREASPEKFITKPIRCGVSVEEWNGKKSNRLKLGEYFAWDGKGSTAWGEGEATAPTEEKKAKLDSPFAKATKKAAAKPEDSTTDDEPPF